MARRILLGRIAGAHGVRGELRIRSYTAEPAAIASYGPLADESGRRTFVLALRGTVRGDELIARIEGIADRDAAEALRGIGLYVDRDRLPPTATPDEYYEADLVGLAAVDRDGNPLGRVERVADYGAGPVLELRRPDGGELLLPFTDAVVPAVDLAAGRLVAVPPTEIEVPPEADAIPGAAVSRRPAARRIDRRAGAPRRRGASR